MKRVTGIGGIFFKAEHTFRETFARFNTASDMDLHCAGNYGAELQLREIQSNNLETLVAEADAELIAFAQQLMRAALDVARRASSDRIWLGVWERNDRALAFYRKFGFEVVGEHMFPVGNDPQRNLVMVRDVEGQFPI
jgi:GNAT superfamily N-acetyltransferase